MANKVWILNNGIHGYNVVIYYSKRYLMEEELGQKRLKRTFSNDCLSSNFYCWCIFPFNFISTRFLLYFEHGLVESLYRCMKSNLEIINKKTKIFDNLDEYMKDGNGDFHNLNLVNFRSIFVAYFSLLLIYLTMFIISKLRKHKILSKRFTFVKNFSFLIVTKKQAS